MEISEDKLKEIIEVSIAKAIDHLSLPTKIEEKWMTEEQALRALCKEDRHTIRKIGREKRIIASKLGQSYRYNTESIENYLNQSIV